MSKPYCWVDNEPVFIDHHELPKLNADGVIMKPVFEAIKSLLQHKGSCSYAEVAKVSGKKPQVVLNILNTNSTLLRISKGKIVGWADWRKPHFDAAWDAGRIYKPGCLINYGAASTIDTANTKPEVEALKEHYICGGLGDSWTVHVIMDTTANTEKLRGLGLLTGPEYLSTFGDTFDQWYEN